MKADRPLLKIEAVSKLYGGTFALDEVNFDVCAGEIHAILGENGAGKSTLSKIIAGAVPPSAGRLTFDGREKNFSTPADSLREGIVMVYQETSLVPTMTVAQNLRLGAEAWLTRFSSINREARDLFRLLDFDVEPLALVEDLGTAKRQMVEIARAVRMEARLILFDEPTASLTPHEVAGFFKLVRSLRASGVAVVFITHALEEALELSDRITVLRDGRLVRTGPTSGLDRTSLVRMMVGRDVPEAGGSEITRRTTRGSEVLSVRNICAGTSVRNACFSLHAGEVVGFAGLVGSGRTEMAKVAAGVFRRDRSGGGCILLRGKPVVHASPAEAVRDGIVYVTEDRKIDGFFETMTADENIYLGAQARRTLRHFLYSPTRGEALARYWLEKLSVAVLDRRLRISDYSGGNQQKVVLAKALAQKPEIVFFDEPTRGVDVGAIPQIHRAIRELADDGKAVAIISSYLPEILAVSDRILVARDGGIVAEFMREQATAERIMLAAAH